jgi:diacylglycerol O-acyltransferase
MTELRYESRMSDADALMWTIEKDPLLRSTITAVSLLDRPADLARVRDRLERGTRLIPRLRQRVVGNLYSLAPPRWEVDPHFDLDYHLRPVNLGGEGTLRSVLDLAQPIAMQGFDRARPLWEMYVVDGIAGERGALIQKIHHSITDGVGSIELAMVLFDLERDPAHDEPMPAAPEVDVLSPAARLLDGIGHVYRRQAGVARRSLGTLSGAATAALRDPAAAAAELAETVASARRLLAPATRPLSPILTGRSLSVRFDTIAMPLDELKRAAKAAGGKLNDAFVAGVAGGLRRYHDLHGAPVDALRMTMPISIRGEDTAGLAGNRFVPARFPVPLGPDDPVARMQAVRELVARQRGERALALTDPLAGVLNRLPTSVTTQVFGSLLKGVDFVSSNVPGAPIPVHFGGAQLVAQFPFGPLSGSAANITLLSWLDEVHIGVNVDPAAAPDVEVFHRCLVEGLDEVRSVG